jgi:Enoyl-CoA hydratase/isomerase
VTDAVLNVEYKDKLAILAMVYRPYNLAGQTLYRALLKALDEAVEAGSRAVLIKSGLRHFCAGADISLWDERIANQGKPAFNPIDVLRGFEQLPIPIVAAIHGACLGGGLEIAMACDFIEPAVLGATDDPKFMGPAGERFVAAQSIVGSLTFPNYLRAMRRADLARDERFSTAERRVVNYDALHGIIQSWIFTFPDLECSMRSSTKRKSPSARCAPSRNSPKRTGRTIGTPFVKCPTGSVERTGCRVIPGISQRTNLGRRCRLHFRANITTSSSRISASRKPKSTPAPEQRCLFSGGPLPSAR